ncbi:MAG: HAMP domain-containing histidine kinase [Patescibacteria group bacterium]|nr:HAMP domain-containing histidine kinase [Patescibacteria group bacterium]
MERFPKKNSFGKWLSTLSVEKKFSIIIGLIIFVLVFELGNFWLSIKVVSGLRAYANGEGLWSKAQKAAYSNLVDYSISFDEAEYEHFLELLKVPLGDKQARLELEKNNPNPEAARQGFLQGGNHPADINDMIFLFRRFRHVSYMDKAIQIWAQGDEKIEQIMSVGQQMRAIALMPIDESNPDVVKARNAKLAFLKTQVTALDNETTVLERNFSATLGEGSRSIKNTLLLLTVLLTVVLGGFALFVSVYIRKIVVQVDRAKSEFVSIASHQLRSPLTAVKWQASRFLEEMEKKNPAADMAAIKKYGESIYLNNQRMIDLVNNILNVSNIDLGTLSIQPQPTSFTEVVDKILRELGPEANLKNLKVTKAYPPQLPQINIDPGLVRIVVQNLLMNAIKYTPQNGNISVKVETTPSDLIFSVKDDGCGIPEQDQGKIFDKFFRTDLARKIDPNGNGLGMYIVKAVIQETGGKIWFNSTVNKGSTFYIQLPLKGAGSRTGMKKLNEAYT